MKEIFSPQNSAFFLYLVIIKDLEHHDLEGERILEEGYYNNKK